jgi:MFS family permease
MRATWERPFCPDSAVVLFHFANAAMLPLLGQRLSMGDDHGSSLSMSACIIVAQLVMIPVATWAGRLAGTYGRKPVFTLGFSVLPLRGCCYCSKASRRAWPMPPVTSIGR